MEVGDADGDAAAGGETMGEAPMMDDDEIERPIIMLEPLESAAAPPAADAELVR
jgi:hypothetical protein